MIPQGQETEYFSLYEISERGTSWLGPLVFGLAIQWTDSYRIAVLAVGIFFIAGLIPQPGQRAPRNLRRRGTNCRRKCEKCGMRMMNAE